MLLLAVCLQRHAGCRQPNHPICIIKEAIIEYLEKNYPGRYTSFDDLYPIVSTKAVSQSVLQFLPCIHIQAYGRKRPMYNTMLYFVVDCLLFVCVMFFF